MEKTNNFWSWFTSLGGKLSQCEVANTFEILNQVDVQVSSLKHRAEFIKNNFNYKFE